MYQGLASDCLTIVYPVRLLLYRPLYEHHLSFLLYVSTRATLQHGTVDYLKKLEIGGDELTKAIIGTMGDLDSYQLPDSKGYTSLMRHVLKVEDAERQQRREEVLSTTAGTPPYTLTKCSYNAVSGAVQAD